MSAAETCVVRWYDGPQVTHSSNMDKYWNKRNIYPLCAKQDYIVISPCVLPTDDTVAHKHRSG